MTSIVLVDDHPMMRKGIRQLIEINDGLEVVAEAGSGEEALEMARQHSPDMILMDLNMKGMDGIQTVVALRQQGITACILMITVSDNDNDVIAALRAGADGYLLKDVEPEELLQAIVRAERGQLMLSPRLTQALARSIRQQSNTAAAAVSQLTGREVEILGLIAAGSANKHIARELGISEATVKVHVKHLLKKLNLRSRVEAAVWAVSNHIV
jgi:two-component system nitrate/nitrite response regulator NarL